MTKIKCK